MIDRKDIIENDIKQITKKIKSLPQGEVSYDTGSLFFYSESGETNSVDVLEYSKLSRLIEKRKAYTNLLSEMTSLINKENAFINEVVSSKYIKVYIGDRLDKFIQENVQERYSKETLNKTLEYLNMDTDLLFPIDECAGSGSGISLMKKAISLLPTEKRECTVFIDIDYDTVIDSCRKDYNYAPSDDLLRTLYYLRKYGYKYYFLYNSPVCGGLFSWDNILKIKHDFTGLGMKFIEGGNMFTITASDLRRLSYDMDEYHLIGESSNEEYFAEDSNRTWECAEENITGEEYFRKYVVENLYYSNLLTEEILWNYSDPRCCKLCNLEYGYDEDYFHLIHNDNKYTVPESFYKAVEFALFILIIDFMPNPTAARQYLMAKLDKMSIAYYKALRYILYNKVYNKVNSRLYNDLSRLGILDINSAGENLSPHCLFQYIKDKFIEELKQTNTKHNIQERKSKIINSISYVESMKQFLKADDPKLTNYDDIICQMKYAANTSTSIDEEELYAKSKFFEIYIGNKLKDFISREDFYGSYIESAKKITHEYLEQPNDKIHWIYETAGSGSSIALLKTFLSSSNIDDWVFIMAKTENIFLHYRNHPSGSEHSIPSEELKQTMCMLRNMGYRNFFLYNCTAFTEIVSYGGMLWLNNNLSLLGIKIVESGMFEITMRELLKSNIAEYFYDKNCHADSPKSYYDVQQFIIKGYSPNEFFKRYIPMNIYYSYAILSEIATNMEDSSRSQILIPDFISFTENPYCIPNELYDVVRFTVLFLMEIAGPSISYLGTKHVFKNYCNDFIGKHPMYRSIFDKKLQLLKDLSFIGVMILTKDLRQNLKCKILLPDEVCNYLRRSLFNNVPFL